MAQTITGSKTVVGLFDTMQQANRAADQLRGEGITGDQIGIIAGNESNRYGDYATTDPGAKDVGHRAGTGAAIGGGLGLVAGLVALAIPGFGPIIAAGPIVAGLTGAVAGAATGGLIGGLTAAGVSESDAKLFENRLRQGGVLLTVRTDDARADRAADILDANGARDVDEDSATTTSQHLTGSGVTTMRDTPKLNTTTTTRDDAMRTGNVRRDVTGDQSIPVVEERVEIGKREVGRRAVRIYSEVQEHPVERDIELREEHIHVDRRPVDRAATDADLRAFKEGSIELTETREEPVVHKESRVVEEVIVGKDVNMRRETIHETARRTEVKVEETGGTTNTSASKMMSGPGYEFGSKYASDSRYRDREWSTVEPDLRRDWEAHGHGTWEEFKDSIRGGWDKIRGRR